MGEALALVRPINRLKLRAAAAAGSDLDVQTVRW